MPSPNNCSTHRSLARSQFIMQISWVAIFKTEHWLVSLLFDCRCHSASYLFPCCPPPRDGNPRCFSILSAINRCPQSPPPYSLSRRLMSPSCVGCPPHSPFARSAISLVCRSGVKLTCTIRHSAPARLRSCDRLYPNRPL